LPETVVYEGYRMLRRFVVWLVVPVLAAAIIVATGSPASAVCTIPGGGDYPILTGTLQVNGTPTGGATLTTSGTGFKPGTTVCLEVASTPVQLGTAKVNKGGGFVTTVTLPQLPDGQHILRAIGTTRGGYTLTLSTAFTNGATVPGAGVKLLRWLLLIAGVAGLVALLATSRRSRRPAPPAMARR
jgi:hypothetical protein